MSNGKTIDNREYVNVVTIKKAIIDYLFLQLSFFFDTNPNLKISILGNGKYETITKNDLRNLSTITFQIEDEIFGNVHDFELKYVFNEDKQNIKKFILCANGRSGHTIQPSSLYIYDKLPNSDSFMFFVVSSYLDNIDTDNRNGLDEYASLKTVDMIHSISYSTLLDKIAATIKQIIAERYSEIEKSNKTVIETIKNEMPYLAKYIDDVPHTVASVKAIRNEALRAFSLDKEKTSERFEIALKNRNLDPDEYNEAVRAVSTVSAAELCEYIVYRSKILQALSADNLINKKEEYLHSIIMPKYTSSKDNYLATNLWVLDDKFMGFIYAASDISFQKVNKELKGKTTRSKYDKNRPDLFVAYDNEKGIKNAVIVEFKSYSATLDEKAKSLNELPLNIGELRRTRTDIDTIWAYIITSLDEKFVQTIADQEIYRKLFFDNGNCSIFYRYLEKHNAHIYICDIDSVVSNAKTRNKAFFDILKIK